LCLPVTFSAYQAIELAAVLTFTGFGAAKDEMLITRAARIKLTFFILFIV
jgi:hypothetical protein